MSGPVGLHLPPALLPCCLIIGLTFGSIFSQDVHGAKLFDGQMQNLTIHSGDTATFNCVIPYRKECRGSGWRHHGDLVYLTGQVQEDSGRYSAVYPGITGNHQLTITRITPEDDGPVDCMALCGADDLDWEISRVYLTVLVAPTDVVISSQQSPFSRIIETRMDENINLTCSVQGGRPTPKLVWFRSSRLIEDHSGYSVMEFKTANATHSSLLFRATPEDTATDFTCQAESPALVKPLASSVQLNVKYPPQAPVIERPVNAKRGIREGDKDFFLTCSTKGGNPMPKLTWFRNGLEEDGSHSSRQNARGAVESVLTFIPKKSDNGAILKCEASNELMPRGMATQMELAIWFGPASVTLNSPTSAKPNSTIQLSCDSGASNPPAEISWTINGRPYREKSSHTQPAADGAFLTTSTVKLVLGAEESQPIHVVCQAINSAISDLKSTSTVTVLIDSPNTAKGASGLPTPPSEIDVLDRDNNKIDPSNSTLPLDSGAPIIGTKPENMTMIIAISASVGGAVFFALLGCLIYVIIRGKAKKFEEMANSDSSGSSKGHTEICSQNGMDIGTDTTGSDVEKTPIESYNQPKNIISPSAVRANAARTYLLDEAYHSPYGSYKHWTAPEPGNHDLYNEVGVDYDGEGDYTEALRRTAMHSLMPHTHSPSPLRPIPNHLTYEPIHKTSMLSTFHGQHIPTYRAEALVDELKGHLV